MIQKTIRDWGSVEFTTTEGAEQQTEWNDRTVYAVDGYNSIAEIGTLIQTIEAKTDFITVTQAVNLDTVESDTATNNAKVSYTDAAQVATNKTNADASKIKTDLLTVTGAIDLDSNVPLLDTANIFAQSGNKFYTDLEVLTGLAGTSIVKISYLNNQGSIVSERGLDFYGVSGGSNSLYRFWGTSDWALRLDPSSSLEMPESTISAINSSTDKSITSKEWVVDSMVNSTTTGEPTGSDKVVNMVSLTQAEYNAGIPVATTYYAITDA